jgi:hypothetical protein
MIAQSLSGGQPKMRAYDPAAAIIKPERLIETTSSLIHHIQKSGSGILPELFPADPSFVPPQKTLMMIIRMEILNRNKQ